MASRRLGVYGRDLPALVPAVAGDAVINTAGMMFLSERGPAKVIAVTASTEWARIFGNYVRGFYGRYAADGFFQNLQGVDGTLYCRRYVPSDATAAYIIIKNGNNDDAIKISAGYRGELDKGSHGKKILFSILHTNRVNEILLQAVGIGDTVLKVSGAINFEKGDYIVISDGVNSETKEVLNKDESENTITVSALTKAFDVLPTAGSQSWGFSVAKTPSSLAGAAAGTYTATVTIDGVGKAVSVDVLGTETLQNIMDAIQTDIGTAGSVVWDSFGNGAIKIVSATTGLSSSVTISDSGLFAALADINPTPNAAISGAASSTVKTINFDLKVYRKNMVGVLEEVENWKYLSMSPSVSTYFESVLNNAFRGSEHIYVSNLLPTYSGDYLKGLPVSNLVPINLSSGGADGTLPSNNDWNVLCSDFDIFDIRHLCNPESVSKSVNDFGENYCKSRGDCIWYSNLPSNQSFEELKVLGSEYVVSSDSYRMNNAQWLQVYDPIGVGIEPTINVPNVGHIMGHVIYWLTKYGYQRVPAGVQEAIKGVTGVFGDQILDDNKRTILADLGINLIQFVPGSGICLRNGRMGSTNRAYKWYNQIFMRLYYKKTFVQSFKDLENVESGEALLSQIFNAVRNYLLVDYNGTNVRTGKKPAFLRTAGSKFDDVVTIICDASNNKLEDVLAGNVNVHIYFTPPPPAESIEIGVGISLSIKSKGA